MRVVEAVGAAQLPQQHGPHVADRERVVGPVGFLRSFEAGAAAVMPLVSSAITALISGDLIMSMVDTGPATAHIASGQLRALAVTSAQRLPSMPQTPTMAELGFKDIEFRFWSGLFAPAGTSKDIVQKLEFEVNRILKQPEVIAQMAAIQVTATGSTSQELSKWLASDLVKWNAVAEGAQMKRKD